MTNLQNNEYEENFPVKRGSKVVITVVICLVCLILAGLIAITALYFSGKRTSTNKDVVITPTDTVSADVNDENIITHNGKKYKYNENISTVLCMGVDNEKEESGGAYVTGRAGQADALYLIVIDSASGKTKVLSIPRDSMAEVDLYSKTGSFMGVEKTQICLAFAYGDGKTSSAENTARSVSRLLYGMPVNSYFVIEDDSIAPLHSAVGDITVIPNETIEIDRFKFYKGTPFTITKDNVFRYLQVRNNKTADASLLRLERQTDYLKKYSAAVINKTKSDITFPIKLYKMVVNNATTNINMSKITYYVSSIASKNVEFEFVQIKGEQIKGEDSFAEFYPDEEALLETVIDTFYEEIE